MWLWLMNVGVVNVGVVNVGVVNVGVVIVGVVNVGVVNVGMVMWMWLILSVSELCLHTPGRIITNKLT